MRAKEIRARAREALRGKWGVAVGVGIVASLLTGGGAVNTATSSADGYLSVSNLEPAIVMLTVATVLSLVAIVIGGAVNLGWYGFHTKLVKGEEVRFRNLFDHFHTIGRGFAMQFMMGLFVFIWALPMLALLVGGCIWIVKYGSNFDFYTMEEVLTVLIYLWIGIVLLSIPVCIAKLRYALTPFLMAEFPDLRVMDAIHESKRLMKGNKWRWFCMELSFIGWLLLGALTVVGLFWVAPYMQTAYAVFYMEVTGRANPEPTPEEPQPPVIPQDSTADPWDRPQNFNSDVR